MSNLPDERIAVLYVDDHSDRRSKVRQRLQSHPNLRCVVADSPEELGRLLSDRAFELVISELRTWGRPELEILNDVKHCHPRPPVMILTAQGSESWAVESMKRGAVDYVVRDDDALERLPQRICTLRETLRGATQDTSPRGARDYCQRFEEFPLATAILDQRGVIRAVNQAWAQSTAGNPYCGQTQIAGVDYLRVCDDAKRQDVGDATSIAHGLGRVLFDRQTVFAADYHLGPAGQERWFQFIATAMHDGQQNSAAVMHLEITDSKRAEQRRDWLLTESLSYVWVGGFDGLLRRWNPKWGDLLGYTHDELVTMPVRSLLHPDDVESSTVAMRRLCAGHGVEGTETRVRCKDGTYKCFLWNAVPYTADGVYFAVGQDITALKDVEQQLRSSQERSHLIATAIKEALWDWSLKENRLWHNDAFREAYGSPNDKSEGILGWWSEQVHPEDYPKVIESLPTPTTDGGQPWSIEYRRRRSDGTYAYVYERAYMVFDHAGEIVRAVGSIVDVSELKKTEHELRESEERFQLAAKATRDAIWDWDLRRDVIWHGEGFQTLFGYPPKEAGHLNWWAERIHPDDLERLGRQVPNSGKSAPQQSEIEYRFRRADGTYADVVDRAFVMYDKEGLAVRVVGSMMDMSERRRAEELAHIQLVELAHIARVNTMGEIATGLAHELNQPLTAITNYAESCAHVVATGSVRHEDKLLTWIDKIVANAHRAGEMIRRLRGFTRKSEPRRSTVRVNEMIREVLDLLETEFRLHGVRVRIESEDAVAVVVDRIQIQQVLVNLLRNAFEAMASTTSDERQVIIASEAAGDNTIQISVEDRGEGIRREHRERIFEAFFTSKRNGVGIGLAISRSIILEHGGRLWMVPNTGRGVTFHFTLPMAGR